VNLAFFGAIWLFLRVGLAFFADDYLATLRVTESEVSKNTKQCFLMPTP